MNAPRYHKWSGSYGPRTLALVLTVTAANGTTTRVASTANPVAWSTSPGPITFNGVYGGEDMDARLVTPGWDVAPFAPGLNNNSSGATGWQPAKQGTGPGCTLRPLVSPPVKIRENITASYGAPVVTDLGGGKFRYNARMNI